MLKRIILARHYGFCMGVKRAIGIAEATARGHRHRVTIFNEIVHNDAVVEQFRMQGVDQVVSVENVDGGTLIISAHGVAPDIIARAGAKGLTVVDATCPLVSRIYRIITRIINDGYHVIHYGDPHHDETKGIVGHAPDHITVVSNREELAALPDWGGRKLGLTVQTTAEQAEFERVRKVAKDKWPQLGVFNTICNATSRRQRAVMEIAPQVELVLVVGSATSANSKRLAHISETACGRGILIGSAADIREEWFAEAGGIEYVGVTAGASTPDFLVENVIDRLVEISRGRAEVIRPKEQGDNDQEFGSEDCVSSC